MKALKRTPLLLRLLLVLLLSLTASSQAQNVHYYFKTLDIRNGLSQNTVNAILQDRQGFLWFGTKDGLDRYDGISFRIFKREECELGNNFITKLHEDREGNIWVGTDAGVFIYDPIREHFTPFTMKSNAGSSITHTVTQISEDEQGDIWLSSDDEGIFCYRRKTNRLQCYYDSHKKTNASHFWFADDRCWIALWSDNLYTTNRDFTTPLTPFKDANGEEVFKGDIINTQIRGTHNRIYVGSLNGLTEINLVTRQTRRLLHTYVRTLQFKTDDELWVGSESGLYIYHLQSGEVTHLTVPDQEEAYTLADNAIYSLCLDHEDGMWIGSYFGGVNYYPHPWTYFEKYYPRAGLSSFGRRVREFCENRDGTLWIGTEDKGLFHFDPSTGQLTPFEHPAIYKNVHGLCLDDDYLWVGTFSAGLNRIDLRTRAVKHYQRSEEENSLNSNDVFAICKTSTGDLWIGTTSGLQRYNRQTDDFTRMAQLKGIFVYDIQEDTNGDLWFATYSSGVYRYDVEHNTWKHFLAIENDSTSLPYNKVISISLDSRKRLWFMTQGGGFCLYDPHTENFIRYNQSNGFPSNVIFKMVDDGQGNLWITTDNGLVCFNPDTDTKRVYTTANGLLTNQFNYQSGFRDKKGCIYFGGINGFIRFDPHNFVDNNFIPPVVITDFFLFNKRLPVEAKGSPLQKSIVYSDRVTLAARQNSFSFHVAALSYSSPAMNKLLYKLDGFDSDWHAVGKEELVSYANLPYGHYLFRLKGSNSDGKWNETERTLRIYIQPPFYLSLWAYLVYALLLIGLIVGTVNYFRQKSRRRQHYLLERYEQQKEREIYTAKIDFFTNVAHEIRTPLTLIKSPLENVLALPEVAPEIRDDLEIMDLNTTRLLDLVNQLLDFRKTETQGFRLNMVECDVAEVLRKTYTRFTPLARQKGLQFLLDAPEHVSVSADREALTKIVSNLLANAVKFAATYIHARLVQEGEQLLLSVSNDGEVVPPSMREEIFKPFIQYKSGTLQTISGTGIGLPLARSLAQLHGGDLSMSESSTENCFVFILPIVHTNIESAGQSSEQASDLPMPMFEESGESASDATLLIVEDTIDMQNYIVRHLSGNYHLLTARNGVEALQVLEKNIVNLIVSDIVMPEMDGLELCNRVKSDLDYSHIPIVLLTAKTTLQSKIEGLKTGADAYIEKPFSVEYLKVCIFNLLSNREKLRASFVHSPFVQSGTITMTKADENFIKQLNEVILSNMQDPTFSLNELAHLMNMSRSSLNRKMKGLLDITPNDYIRLERLRRAAQLLQDGECRVNEVCYMVGFNTPSYFTKCFVKQFGKLPKDAVNIHGNKK